MRAFSHVWLSLGWFDNVLINAINMAVERSSKLLTWEVVLWLPLLFFTTYLGIYEAYEFALEKEFLGLRYNSNFAVILVIPSMIPTIFTSYSVLNRRRLTMNLMDKISSLHHSVTVESSNEISEYLLSNREYETLTIEDKLRYIRDLSLAGRDDISNKLKEDFYIKYCDSNTKRLVGCAHYSRSLIKSDKNTMKEQFKHSKKAYELFAEEPKDWTYFRIMYAYCVDSIALGYPESIKIVDQIYSTLDTKYHYWRLRLELRKMWLLFRTNPALEFDFDEFENRINFETYDKDQLTGMRSAFTVLKKEVLLNQNRLQDFRDLTENVIYWKKWSGLSYNSSKTDLGRVLRKEGRYDESIKIFNQLLSHYSTNDNTFGKGVAMANLGKSHILKDEFQPALDYGKKSLEIFDSIDYARGQIESMTLIVDASEKLGLDSSNEKSELGILVNSHGILADKN